MGKVNRTIGIGCKLAMSLVVGLIMSIIGHTEPASASSGIEGFFEKLPGDWVGTVAQPTDGKFAETKYFHVATKQLSPDLYETVFTYYRLDAKTGAPVLAGVSGMETKINAAGTATNILTGKGDILVDVNTRKPESHELTEVLHTSPAGGLQGTGNGSINVSGMLLGLGKNGTVQGYSSTWILSNDVLKISQRFKVRFKAFLFGKTFTIATDYTAKRGSDIIGLMNSAEAERAGH